VQIGALTAVREYGKKYGYYQWLWQCPCGRRFSSLPGPLRARQQRNPGEKIRCLHCWSEGRRQQADLSGKKFGHLTAVRRAPNRQSYWICRCICGEKFEVVSSKLKKGEMPYCRLCRYSPMRGDGAKVRRARLLAGLTLERAANLLGLTRQRWQQFEATEKLKPEELRRAMSALKSFVAARAGRKGRG
jgi:hypothetical protein